MCVNNRIGSESLQKFEIKCVNVIAYFFQLNRSKLRVIRHNFSVKTLRSVRRSDKEKATNSVFEFSDLVEPSVIGFLLLRTDYRVCTQAI